MSDWFWKKLNLYFSWAFIAAIFGLLAFLLNIEIKDFDLWLHLAMGKYIFQTGIIPSTDILSFTKVGVPWVNHEWLHQVVVYLSYATAGAQGLVNFQMVVVGLSVGLLLLMGYNRERPLVPLVTLLLVVLAYQSRLTHRPDLVSLLYFVSFVFILSAHIQKRWAMFALFFIQVLWTNTHGFFIFGPILVMTGISAEMIKRFVKLPFNWAEAGNLTDQEFKHLIWALVGVLLACFVNPLFIEGVLYPLRIMFSLSGESAVFFENIVELQRPITLESLFATGPYPYYRMLIALSAGSFLLNFRKIDVSCLMLWVVFLLFSLGAMRNVVFFAVMAYLAIIVNLQYIDWNKISGFKKFSHNFCCQLSIIVKIALTAYILQLVGSLALNGYYDFNKMERKVEFDGQLSLRNHSYEAVDFLVENEIKGNFFNSFNAGAYLIGRTYPNIKVFIDGRTEVYGSEFFINYRKIWNGDPDLLDQVIDQYAITGAFIDSARKPAPARLTQYFYESEEWILVYFNYDAIIFLKDVEKNKEWIDAFEIDLEKWEIPKISWERLGLTKVSSYQYGHRAKSFYNIDLFDLAKEESLEALRISPEDVNSYHVLGKIALQDKEYDQAYIYLRQARMLGKRSLELTHDIIRSYMGKEMFEKSEVKCLDALRSKPNHRTMRLLLVEIHVLQDRYDHVLEEIDHIDGLTWMNADDLMGIADLLEEKKAYGLAKEVYQRVVDLDGKNEEARKAVSQMDKHL